MKFVYPDIHNVFDTKYDKVPSLIIENPKLLYCLLRDISGQLDGNDGISIVSEEGKVLNFEKHVELITDFVHFTINHKKLVNQAITALDRIIVEGALYEEAMGLLSATEEFLLKSSLVIKGDVTFPKLNMFSLIKASGFEFREDYDCLPEKIIDYIELVTEYDREKLFILYNLRSVVSDQEVASFLDTILRRGYNILMIDSSEHTILPHEHRYIVDNSLCEIC